MNDYEYAFKEDVKEKKSLVASSRHKKNGSKSKKVTLPSDGMTRKQWESKNGEITTVQMNQPMTYKEFKSIPEDLQERYLACLVDGYRVTSKHLAEMLGTDHRTLRSYIRNHGFDKIHFRKGAVHLTEEEQADWDEFLSRRDISEETVTTEEEATDEPVPEITQDPEKPNDISDDTCITLFDFINLTSSIGPQPPKFVIFADEQSMYDYSKGDHLSAEILCVHYSMFRPERTLPESVYTRNVLSYVPFERNVMLVLIDMDI